MIRLFRLCLVVAAGFACFWLYQIKEDARVARQRIAAAREHIDTTHKAINLLKAEWSNLSQPARLQALIERHEQTFNLVGIKPAQIVTQTQLADRLPPLERLDAGGLENLLGADNAPAFIGTGEE